MNLDCILNSMIEDANEHKLVFTKYKLERLSHFSSVNVKAEIGSRKMVKTMPRGLKIMKSQMAQMRENKL